jgi:hypothetical protein
MAHLAAQEAAFKEVPVPQADKKELFYRHFQAECTDIQDLIGKLEEYSLIGGEKQDAIDHVLAAISRLSNEVSDSSEFLPPYDQKTYSRVSRAERILSLLYQTNLSGYQSSRGEVAGN